MSLLASCTGSNETTPGSTTPGSTDSSTPASSDTGSTSGDIKELYNFLKDMQYDMLGHIEYSDFDDATETHNYYYSSEYIVMDSTAYIMANSYDATETGSEKIAYGGTLKDDKFTLSSVAFTRSINYSTLSYEYNYVTDLSTSNYAYQIGRKTASNMLKTNDDGVIYTTNTGWIQLFAQAIGYSDYKNITSGEAQFFYSERYSNWEVDITVRVDGEDETFDPVYLYGGDDAKNDTMEELVADPSLFLGDSLTDTQIAPITGDYSTFTTDLTDYDYGTLTLAYDRSNTDYKSLSLTQAISGSENTTTYKGNDSSLEIVYLNAMNTVQSEALTTSSGQKYTWSNLGDPKDSLNPKAFIKQSDGSYKYIGLPTNGENIWTGMAGLSASTFGGSYYGLTAYVANGVVSSFDFEVYGYTSAGSFVTLTLETTVSGTKGANAGIPTPLETDATVEADLGAGLAKLSSGTTTYSTVSSISTIKYTDSTGKEVTNPGFYEDYAATYYYDATNKALLSQVYYNEAVQSLRGWRQGTAEDSSTYLTPFKIVESESTKTLQASNVNIDNVAITALLGGLSSAFLTKVEGKTNTYKFKYLNFEGLEDSFLMGPAGYSGIDSSSIEFVTDGNGTITSITYGFSFAYSSSVTVSGTETLTLAYGESASNPATGVDLSQTIAEFVAPTTWAEEDPAIQTALLNLMTEEDAAAFPYYFVSGLHGNWEAEYDEDDKAVTIVASASSTNAAAFINGFYAKTKETGSTWTYVTSETVSSMTIYAFADTAQKYGVMMYYYSNYLVIAIGNYADVFGSSDDTTTTSSIEAIVPEKQY